MEKPQLENKKDHADTFTNRIDQINDRQSELNEIIKSGGKGRDDAIRESEELGKELIARQKEKEEKIVKMSQLREELKQAEKANKEKDVLEIENKIRNLEDNIEKSIQKKEEEKQNNIIAKKLKTIGLNDDDFKDTAWKNFSKAEKLLILEQVTQDTLSRVKEIGEKRFEEKNKIERSWNPLKWRASAITKTWHKIGKSFWISEEEKDVIKEVEQGKMKPDRKTLVALIERQSELGLSVVEKDGKAFIEFSESGKELSKEQKTIIDNFNRVANNFSQIPDSWRNEKSAKSTDKMFATENHKKFERSKKEYEEQKALLIESKVKQYEANGMTKTEAKEKAMLDVKDMDFKLAILQFTNTNPDAIGELNKIKNESSWGRLVNNENIWRAGYMATGYGARTAFTTTIGWMTAPITAGVIGGIRARRKANKNINKAFNEGRKEETFLERKKEGKRGLFDDKNKNTNFVTESLSGSKVNTKEVAAFIDADSQKQRIDNLISKIENAKDDKTKASLMIQLESRLHYIEQKQDQGLINYGKENPIAKNYELFKTMSEAYAISTPLNNLNIELTKEMREDLLERNRLLSNIMENNEKNFGKKIAYYKNMEMARGAMIGAGFAVLGGIIKEYTYGNEIEENTPLGEFDKYTKFKKIDLEKLKELEKLHPERLSGLTQVANIEHANIGAVSANGQGAIATFRQLQKNLLEEYGDDLKNTPDNIKHIINTDAHKLAQEYGMYKPGEVNESSLDLKFLKVDKDGNLTYQKIGDDTYYKADGTYEGKMFDSDHSGLKIKTGDNIIDDKYKIPEQTEPIGIKQNIDKEIGVENLENNLTPEEITKLNETHLENLKHIFPNLKDWDNIKNVTPAEKLFTMETVADKYKPLVAYVKNLKEITGINPNQNETIPMYIKRALEEAQKNGNLDKVIYPKNELIEQFNQEKITEQITSSERKIIVDHTNNNLPSEENPIEETKIDEVMPLNYKEKMNLLTVSENNIDRIYPDELSKSMIWGNIKNYKIGKIIGNDKITNWSTIFTKYDEESLKESFSQLSIYIQKLEKISGLKPTLKSENLAVNDESVSHYIDRALKKIQGMGKMDDIKL